MSNLCCNTVNTNYWIRHYEGSFRESYSGYSDSIAKHCECLSIIFICFAIFLCPPLSFFFFNLITHVFIPVIEDSTIFLIVFQHKLGSIYYGIILSLDVNHYKLYNTNWFKKKKIVYSRTCEMIA